MVLPRFTSPFRYICSRCAKHLSYSCSTQWFYSNIAEISNGTRRTSNCQQRHDRTRYGEDIGIPIGKADQLQAKRQAVIFEHRE